MILAEESEEARRGISLARHPLKTVNLNSRRRKLRSYLYASAVALLASGTVMAAPGENALDFLNLPVSANSAALGQGNFAGIVGPEAIFFNPSLLGQELAMFASHHELLIDTRSEILAVSVKLDDRWTLGAGFLLFDPGNIEGYSINNSKIGNIEAGSRMARLGVSSSGKISYGLSVSYYQERLDDRTGNGLGLGAGLSSETDYGRFAMTVDNLGPEFAIGDRSAPLPRRITFSGWLPLNSGLWEFSFDMSHRFGVGFLGAVGLQYNLSEGLALRAGANNNEPLAAGLRIAAGKVAFDYSFIPQKSFGDKHLFSILLVN